jgi:dynein heavy chain
MEERRSQLLNDCKTIESLITDKINEAKDNIKYLSTLDKFIEPLYTGTTEEIIESLASLLNAIKMIQTISKYYNLSKILTVLFMKVTN